MAKIVVIGSDVALVEGLAQTLAASGHHPVIATSIAEAVDATAGSPALMAVVERSLAVGTAEALRLPLAPGGSLVLYHSALQGALPALPRAVQRLTLAELTLPLERQRLVALVQHVEGRVVRAGRAGYVASEREEERAT